MQGVLYLRNFTTSDRVNLLAEASPLPVCDDDEVTAAVNATGDYTPSNLTEFVTLTDGNLTVGDEPFLVRGVNYYPSRYPWRRFLTETDRNTLQTELAMMQDAGFNSLRVFLWNEALFNCEGNGAVPDPDAFARLDMILQESAAYNFRLIVTLNDLPDLSDHVLYLNPPHIEAQTEFIVNRYREEPAILAWDLRNEGDIDYDGFNAFDQGAFAQDVVIDWLAETSEQVRGLDRNHLITAGWRYNEHHTIPYVDFISFHHWRDANSLADRLNRIGYDKPVLLQEFGYTTFDRTPEEQGDTIYDVIRLVENDHPDKLGWMIWTAFDFPLTATCYPGECVSADNREHYFGIWTQDYTPKPAIKQHRSRYCW
jgi:endo-1,4-beta-mannosidase